jgi:hypothetical protein
MRKATLLALLISGAAVLALVPTITIGQPGGGMGRFGKGGGGGGFGGGGFGRGGINPNQDPDKLFEILANGKSTLAIADTKGPINGMLTGYANENGISGTITRQQFKDFFAYVNSKSGNSQNSPNPGGGGFFKKKMGGGNEPAASTDSDIVNQGADLEFKKRDSNGDGKLNNEEMPMSLRQNLAKWDKNGDGLIDMYEYRAYFLARMQGREDATFQGSKGGVASIVIDEEDLDRKPVVYRVGGKQPPGLPDWFNKLDTDKDGQVALYEWRVAGKTLDDFKTWDLNDDGFITAEEAAKVQVVFAKDNPTKGSLASTGYQGGGEGGERPSMGNGDRPKGPFQWPGGMMFGKGKDGKGGDGKGKGGDYKGKGGFKEKRSGDS